ncbi:MAG: hypothetical protein HY393_00345 [Candidatus Diapherotrites archaeon]|nr:hypothetical protein [Candidatus Diapherotrites archaeon]
MPIGRVPPRRPSRNSTKKQRNWGRIAQLNKWRGLRKLALIAKGLKGKATVSPWITLQPGQRFPEGVRAPRLLVRTDERGKEYRQLQWRTMPRWNSTPSTIQNEIAVKTAEFPPKEKRKTIFIVHPTRNREDIEHDFRLDFLQDRDGRKIIVMHAQMGRWLSEFDSKKGKLILHEGGS